MNFSDFEIIDIPDDEWLTRLRKGHFVYMAKEKAIAQVEWAYEPPGPGLISGRIGIKRVHFHEGTWYTGHCDSWYVKSNGTGFDGKALLLPLKNNCPKEAKPISDPWIIHVEKTLSNLIFKIDKLDKRISSLENDSHKDFVRSLFGNDGDLLN